MAYRRGNRLRQKPWNKPTRIEKFWAVPLSEVNVTSFAILTNGTAQQVVNVSGTELAAQGIVQNGIGPNSALAHVKLHRIQGQILAWLDPTTSNLERGAIDTAVGIGTSAVTLEAGAQRLPDVHMVNYVWLKLKTDADSSTDPAQLGAATNFNPRPGQDWPALMVRDDILAWGCVPVFGIRTRMLNQWLFGATTTVNNTEWLTEQGQYSHEHVAKIPLPRIGKLGMNLRRGERLACFAASFPGPGGVSASVEDDASSRDVIVFPQLRYFCSL